MKRWASASSGTIPTMTVAGRIVWHDLMTNDVEGARRFYSGLFAWCIKTEGEWSFIYPGATCKCGRR